MNDIIKSIEAEQLKSEVTDFRVGDTVKVYAKVKEGNRERTQVFEGTVLKRQNGGARDLYSTEVFQRDRRRKNLAVTFPECRENRSGTPR